MDLRGGTRALAGGGEGCAGRKQYRYHSLYREVRNGTKFSKLPAFAKTLPRIRARVEKDLACPGLPKERILAAIVRLLDATVIRVGNEEYARQNESFGLTTLHSEHVEAAAGAVRFHFRGKSGKFQELTLEDRRLARIVRKCQHLPGQELFLYLDENREPAKISSEDVNEYIRKIADREFTAKDFRTWRGTAEMAWRLKRSDRLPALRKPRGKWPKL